jgi:hypothetical protein
MAEREVRFRIVGDASSATEAAKQASRGLNQLKDSTQEAGKEAEKSSLSHKDMHKAMHAIGAAAPEVGLAIKSMTSTASAGLAGLLILFEQTKEGISNLQKSLTTSEWENYKSVVEGAKKGLEGLTLEAESFARAMEHAAKAAQTAAEQAEALAKIHTAESSAMDKVRDAQKRFELAQADQIKDPEEKEKKKAEIELRYAADKNRRENEDAKRKINEEYRLAANEEFFQQHNAAKLQAAREHAAGLGTEEDVNKKIDVEKGRLKKTEEEIAEKQKRFDELGDKGRVRRSTPEQHEYTYLGQQLEQLGSIQSGQQNLIRRLEGRRPGQLNAIRAAGEEVKDLEKQQSESLTRSHRLRENLPTDERVAAIERGARGEVVRIDAASQVARGNIGLGQAGLLAQSAGAVKPNPAFAKLPQDMAQLLNEMSAFVQAVPKLQQAIESLRAQVKTRNLNQGF